MLTIALALLSFTGPDFTVAPSFTLAPQAAVQAAPACPHADCPCPCHPGHMPPVPAKVPPAPAPVAYYRPSAPALPARNAACTTVYGADGRAYTSCSPAPAAHQVHAYDAGFRVRRGLFGSPRRR